MKTRSLSAAMVILSSLAMPFATDESSSKVKIKDDSVVIKDKSKPVRRALEDSYARLAEAIEKNDAEVILAFRHPEFSAIDFQDRRWSTEEMEARTRQMVDLIKPPIDAGFELGIIDVNGEEAVVTIRQSFSRMQMMAGQLRKVETSVTQDETWTKTQQGWRLRFVQNVHDMEWYVDGKRVEPGKPYDPEAPPYEPSHPTDGSPRSWGGVVQTHGALRAMLHEGQTGATVTLDKILPNPNVYALGALADLSGEITVVGGKAYLARPDGTDATRTETALQTNAAATLLVVSQVPAWHGIVTERPIRFEELDEAIATLATAAGMNIDERFPFLMEGSFDDLQWHVIDGHRLTSGADSHQDHMAGAIKTRLDRASGTLVGFYSANDMGVFTHMGSRTHIHCALDEPLATGHVDHVIIPVGTTVKFPG